jgi:hypothetical protein
MIRLRWLFALLILSALGCGGKDSKSDYANGGRTVGYAGGGRAAARAALPDEEADKHEVVQQDGKNPVEPMPRKIIYNATVKLVVEDLDRAEEKLAEMLRKSVKGYVVNFERKGGAGSPRAASWTLRVPVERFDDFRTELLRLGYPEVDRTDSRDVTEEFYDLDARIRVSKADEQALIELLKKTGNNWETNRQVRKELREVRTQIEQLEGKLKRLATLSALATFTVEMREVKDYVPPQEPTFGSRLGGIFQGSWDALVTFGKWLLIAVVALAPWLPLLLVAGIATRILVRRWIAQHALATAAPQAAGAIVSQPPPQTEGA